MALSASNVETSRLQSVDLLKGLAVLAMVQVHLTELFAHSVWQQSLAGKLSLFAGGPAAAPLFMVMMGYLAGLRQRKPLFLLLRGLKLVFWGLLLNLGLNAHLLIKIWFEKWPQNPLHYVFGADIFFLAGLSTVLLAFIAATGRYWFVVALAMLIGIIFSAQLEPWPVVDESLPAYLLAFVHSDAAWSYFPLVPWAVYPIAGYLVAGVFNFKAHLLIHERHYLLMAFAGTAVLALTFKTGWNAAIDLQSWYHHQAPVVLWNLLFVATTSSLAMLFFIASQRGFVTKFLCWAGRRVTAFYVFQWLIIGNLATMMFQTQYPLQLLFWFVSIIAVSAVLVWLWYKLKGVFMLLLRPIN